MINAFPLSWHLVSFILTFSKEKDYQFTFLEILLFVSDDAIRCKLIIDLLIVYKLLPQTSFRLVLIILVLIGWVHLLLVILIYFIDLFLCDLITIKAVVVPVNVVEDWALNRALGAMLTAILLSDLTANRFLRVFNDGTTSFHVHFTNLYVIIYWEQISLAPSNWDWVVTGMLSLGIIEIYLLLMLLSFLLSIT